jgi:hypothetical protein
MHTLFHDSMLCDWSAPLCLFRSKSINVWISPSFRAALWIEDTICLTSVSTMRYRKMLSNIKFWMPQFWRSIMVNMATKMSIWGSKPLVWNMFIVKLLTLTFFFWCLKANLSTACIVFQILLKYVMLYCMT